VRRALVTSGLAIAALLILIQLVPVDRSNPPLAAELQAPAEVAAVLRAACYDCHSNETRWPWYSRLAPASWLVARDVDEGRSRLNLSQWGAYEPTRRERLAEEMWEQVAEGEMPPALYVLAHPEARLSASDRELLRSWSASIPGEH
jgi:hypothetical protein